MNPIANAQNYNALFETPLSITLSGSDPDGDPITYDVKTFPSNGVLSGTVPNLTYTPNTGYTGTDSFTYCVEDSTGLESAAAAVSINVSDIPCLTVTDQNVVVGGVAGVELTNPNGFDVTVAATAATAPVNGLPANVPANGSIVIYPTESFCYMNDCGSVVVNPPVQIGTVGCQDVNLGENISFRTDNSTLPTGVTFVSSGTPFWFQATKDGAPFTIVDDPAGGPLAFNPVITEAGDYCFDFMAEGSDGITYTAQCCFTVSPALDKQAELAANPNRCGFGENAAGGTNLVEVDTHAEFFAAIQVDDNYVCLTDQFPIDVPITSPISSFADRLTIDGSRAPGVNFDGLGLANNQWIFRFFGDDIVLHNFSGNGSGANNGSNISFINLYGKPVWVDKVTATAFNDDFINILLDADEVTVSRVKATNTSKSVFVFNPSFPGTRVTVHSSELAAISRNPYLSAGQLHSFNNWVHNNTDSGTRAGRTAVQSGLGGFTHTGTAEIISQENVFDNIQFQALVTTTDNAAAGGNEGFIESINDNLNGEPWSGNVTFVSAPSLFTPPDCGFIKPNSEVIAYVQAEAGAD